MNAATFNRIALDVALSREGYRPLRELPTGELAGVMDMMWTAALCVGLDEIGCRVRYTFATRAHAESALATWSGFGDPLGPWIVRSSNGEDRLNPAFVEDAA